MFLLFVQLSTQSLHSKTRLAIEFVFSISMRAVAIQSFSGTSWAVKTLAPVNGRLQPFTRNLTSQLEADELSRLCLEQIMLYVLLQGWPKHIFWDKIYSSLYWLASFGCFGQCAVLLYIGWHLICTFLFHTLEVATSPNVQKDSQGLDTETFVCCPHGGLNLQPLGCEPSPLHQC